ncbi:MAG: CapA family protein, partial [bacterium]
MKNKTIIINIAFLLLILSVSIFYLFVLDVKNDMAAEPLTADVFLAPSETLENFNQEEIVKLGFVGDIMLDRSVEKSVIKNGAGDYNYIFQNIAPTLKSFDWLFGNLEGPVSDKGKRVCGSIYSFQMNPVVISSL